MSLNFDQPTLPGRLAAVARAAVLAVATLGVLLAVGYLIPGQPIVALGLTLVVLGLAISFLEPAAIPLVAVPLLLIVYRVGAGGVDLSVSDFILAVATVPAVLLTPKPIAREMWVALWLSVVYQAATLFTVINNPYAANIVEWFHTGLLVGGSLLVGWMLGRRGKGVLALRLLMAAAVVLAAGAVISGLMQYAQGDFSAVYPKYPLPMHKNFIGGVCMMAIAVMYAAPRWVRWPGTLHWLGIGLLLTALLMAQARQSIVGLAAAVLVLVLRSDQEHKRSKIIVLAIIPALVAVYVLVRDQLKSGNEFSSANQRLTWFQDSIDIWQTQPWLGVGLRFWYTDRFQVKFQPPNALLEVLTSAGVVGLLGFLLLIIGSLVLAWHLPTGIGSVAVAVLVARAVQSQFDLFWAAVNSSLPFLILGICIGMVARTREEPVPDLSSTPEPRPVGDVL